MKRIILTVFLLSKVFFLIEAQKLKFGFQTGVGSYSMNTLKELNEKVSYNLPFESQVVSDFPPYWNYKPKFILQIRKIGIGFNCLYMSTGSRISAKDYSAEYQYDMLVKSLAPGFILNLRLNNSKVYLLDLYANLNRSKSILKMKERFVIDDDVVEDEVYKFTSKNYFFEPGLEFSYNVGFTNISLNLGYQWQFGGTSFVSTENSNNSLHLNTSRTISPEWNGYRIGISCLFVLG